MTFITEKRDAFLTRCAGRVITKYEPGIIAVTGGMGKTLAQSALSAVLRDVRSLRTTSGAFGINMRIPLAALGDWKEGAGFSFWIHALLTACKTYFLTVEYPELLILECPHGESKNFLTLARPQITVVTALANEDEFDAARLVTALPSNGYAVINRDDPQTRKIAERTRARIITFGFEEGADVRITSFTHRLDKTQKTPRPLGISFVLKYANQSVHIAMDGAFGKTVAYAAAGAACVGTAFGLHLARTAESLRYAELPENCMHLSMGKKGIYVLNDTATQSEAEMQNALEAVLELPARRVIGIFGTLKKGNDKEDAYETIHRLAIKACDVIITVGSSPITIDNKKKIRFDTGEEAGAELQAIIERDDLVLITGQGLEAVLAALCSYRLVVRT